MEEKIESKEVISLLWGHGIGGVTTYFDLIAKAKSKNSLYNLTSIAFTKDTKVPFFSVIKESADGVISYRYRFIIVALVKLAKEIRLRRAKYILSHDFNATIIAHYLKLICGLNYQLICSYHGWCIQRSKIKKILTIFYNYSCRNIYKNTAKTVITVSNYSKNKLVKKGVPPEKIYVIHNGVSDCNIVNSRLSAENKKNFTLGVVARLVPLKGIDVLINAVKDLDAVDLVIVGDGPERKNLEKLANKNKVSVTFVGEQKNICSWLSVFDVFVLPSRHENHSIAILEAMRSAKPIIATDVGGTPESIKSGVEGILIKKDCKSQLLKSICFLRDNEDKGVLMGENARIRFLACFTDKVFMEKMVKCLNKAVASC